MGIPSYFSYLSKHHNIINKISSPIYIDNVYFDCNSLIYCALSELNANADTEFDDIFDKVIQQIIQYVGLVVPTSILFIAFDGVAPFAKMKQQRERRYRSHIIQYHDDFINRQFKKNGTCKDIPFNKASITPGTNFMTELDNYFSMNLHDALRNHFEKTNSTVPTIVYSGPSEQGEGEHKLFSYIRDKIDHHASTSTIIYGMDADLIILALQHVKYCNSISLFREDYENNIIQLEIDKLKTDILQNISPKHEINENQRISDYVLLSFLLGNDFLPHSPVINIRTNGIKYLINAYKTLVAENPSFYLTYDTKILNKNVKKLFTYLSVREHVYLSEEHKIRDKMIHRTIPKDDFQRSKDLLLRIPQISRKRELQINPENQYNWRKRYYETLFRTQYSKEFKKDVCISYLKGLQWCFSYYTQRCIDSMWVYPYHYPPLFTDLMEYIPSINCDYFPQPIQTFLSPLEQLCYVLPPSSYDLLPAHVKNKLNNYMKSYGMGQIVLQWEYCAYIWESHPILPVLSIETIKQISS